MSRTYRKRTHVERECNCGSPIWTPFGRSEEDEIAICRRRGTLPWRQCHCDTWFYDCRKRNFKRDRKDPFKPDKLYKVVKKKIRKAKERAAIQKKDYDNIPIFKHTDTWDWN